MEREESADQDVPAQDEVTCMADSSEPGSPKMHVTCMADSSEPDSPKILGDRPKKLLEAGAVAVAGPSGIVRHIQISPQDTPASIEHCLCAIFDLGREATVVLLNSAGCAVPLGMGLLSQPGATYKLEWHSPKKTPEGPATMNQQSCSSLPARNLSIFSTATTTPFDRSSVKKKSWIEVAVDENEFEVSPDAKKGEPNGFSIVPNGTAADDPSKVGSKRVSEHEPPGFVENSDTEAEELSPEEALDSEHLYWYRIAEGFRRLKVAHLGDANRRRASVSSHCSTGESSAEEFLNVAAFDTSDNRIDATYSQWTRKGTRPLTIGLLGEKLFREHGVSICTDVLEDGLYRIRKFVKVGDDDSSIHRAVFGGFWQRMLLGAAYRRSFQKKGVLKEDEPVQLIEYSEHSYDSELLSEEELLFRSPLRIHHGHRKTQVGEFSAECAPVIEVTPARWVRCNKASQDRLLRMGLKFYLHPLATGDAIAAARNGMTKIDRHGHQYFVSLEVYVLQERNYYINDQIEDTEPLKVGQNIARYGIYLVATGNPQGGHRDWLLSLVPERDQGIQDPLNFFHSDSDAARTILDKVQNDLEAHGQLREYQADFLLYTVIDRASAEFMSICVAYGHRLQWLQKSLKKMKKAIPEEHVEEVARMQLEMQELKQWIGQIRSIIKTLNQDCKATKNNREVTMPWNFGAYAQGRGKSVSMFLCKTEAHIDELSDRLVTMGQLANNFLESYERHRDAFVNNILLTLTVATAVFMPAQLLAGIYGTNFVDENGTPTIPELTWKYGYWYFLSGSAFIVVTGLLVAYCLLRRR